MSSSDRAINVMKHRLSSHKQWLLDDHPEVFEEQKHTDEGTPERAYWHAGYCAALVDALGWLDPTEEDEVAILLSDCNSQ